MDKIFFIQKIPLWVWLLILASVTFFSSNTFISSDMGWYMCSALNIHLGRGYTDIYGSQILTRPFLFPLMIALAYRIFGISPPSAFWVVRLFCILNPIVIYFLGKKLFNKWIGFIAGFLILTSYAMNYWSYRHLDAVWPFFVLVSLFFLYQGFEKKKYVHYIFSAFFMGLAYYVKQAPIILFPLPFLMWGMIKEYRTKINFIGSLIFITLIILVISPWCFYVYTHAHNIKLAFLGAGGVGAANSILQSDFFSAIKKYFSGLILYYKGGGDNSLGYNFPLAPLFILGWGYVLLMAIRKEKNSIILASIFLLYSPYISYVGLNNLRVGQLLGFLLLTYIVVSVFLFVVFDKLLAFLHNRFKLSWLNKRVFLTSITILLIGIQTFVGINPNLKFIKKSFKGLKKKRIEGYWSLASQKAGEWITKNIEKGAKFACDKPSQANPVYFYARGEYPIYIIPVINTFRNLNMYNPIKGKLIFLSSQWAYLHPINRFYALSEDYLADFLVKNNIQYIIVGPRRNFLTIYYKNNPNFQELAQFGQGRVKIFQILSFKKSFDEWLSPLITARARKYLSLLHKKSPERYEKLKQQFFKKVLGLDDQKVIGIENGSWGNTVKVSRIYE